MQTNAHSLPRGTERRCATHPRNSCEDPVSPRRARQGEKHGYQGAEEEQRDAAPPREGDAGGVPVSDGPADEVGVGLLAEGVIDDGADFDEGGGVGSAF